VLTICTLVKDNLLRSRISFTIEASFCYIWPNRRKTIYISSLNLYYYYICTYRTFARTLDWQ